jgi:MFS family permease
MKMRRKEFFLGLIVFCLAALFLIYEMAVQVSPSVMTNQLMKDFGINAAALGWMASVYYYSYTIMQIPAGLLFDRYGPRTLLTLAATLCACGVLFFAVSETIYTAATGRFLMGIGSSFAYIGVLVVSARWFDKKYFPLLVGITQFLACFGAIAGEAPLAKAVAIFGWRDLMWTLMIVGFVLAALYLMFFRDHPTHEFADGNSHENSILQHLRVVMTKPQSWFCGFYAFTGWGPVIMFAALWGVPYLSERFQVSDAYAAIGTMMMLLGSGLASPLIGSLSSLIGRRKPILWLGALLGCVCFSMILYMPGLTFFSVCLLLFFAGMGTAAHILTFAIASDNNPPQIVGTSLGFNNMAVVVGGVILQPLGGVILNYFWAGTYSADGVPLFSVDSYTASLSLIPILYFAGFLVAFLCIRETFCKNTYKTK